MTKIELTDLEIEQFKLFRQHQDVFESLLNSGFFDLRNGQAVIDFDSQGTMQQIRLQRLAYKRKASVL